MEENTLKERWESFCKHYSIESVGVNVTRDHKGYVLLGAADFGQVWAHFQGNEPLLRSALMEFGFQIVELREAGSLLEFVLRLAPE